MILLLHEFLDEESPASKQAKQMGLVSKGWGRWADPKTGAVTHKTDNGQLVPVQGGEQPQGQPQGQPAAAPPKSKEPAMVQDPQGNQFQWSFDTPKAKPEPKAAPASPEKISSDTTNVPGVGPVPKKEVVRVDVHRHSSGMDVVRAHFSGLGNQIIHISGMSGAKRLLNSMKSNGARVIWAKGLSPRSTKLIQKAMKRFNDKGDNFQMSGDGTSPAQPSAVDRIAAVEPTQKDKAKQFARMLKGHDWHYQYADDQRAWRNGVQQRQEIDDFVDNSGIDPRLAARLWQRYAVPDFKEKLPKSLVNPTTTTQTTDPEYDAHLAKGADAAAYEKGLGQGLDLPPQGEPTQQDPGARPDWKGDAKKKADIKKTLAAAGSEKDRMARWMKSPAGKKYLQSKKDRDRGFYGGK